MARRHTGQIQNVPLPAISTLSASLSFLPDAETHNLATAHQYMGLAHVELGELEEADICAGRSATFAPPGREKLKLSWLRARIAEAKGDDRRALSLLEPVALHPDISALDRGLATAEVVRMKLRIGDVHDAVILVRTVVPVIAATDNEQVQAAVLNLIEAARHGDLTIAATEQLIEAMQEVCSMGACVPRPAAR